MSGLDRRESTTEAIGAVIPPSYFHAYLKGNFSFPQAKFGIIVLMAKAMLKDPHLDLEHFARSRFSEEQLNQVKVGMSKAHAIRGIALGSEHDRTASLATIARTSGKELDASAYRVVPDQRLHELWDDVKFLVLGAIGSVCGVFVQRNAEDGHLMRQETTVLANQLEEKLRDPAARARALDIFESFDSSLRDSEARDIAYTAREEALPSRSNHRDLHATLVSKLFSDYTRRTGLEIGSPELSSLKAFLET